MISLSMFKTMLKSNLQNQSKNKQLIKQKLYIYILPLLKNAYNARGYAGIIYPYI